MEFGSEVARRREAVRLVDERVSVAEVARRVERSRRWVYEWVGRFRAEGDIGLEDRSRAPKTQPAKTRPETAAKILETRSILSGKPEASIGALSILAQMEREGWSDIPSVATIDRILSDAGVTRQRRKRDRSSEVKLPLPQVAGPGVWQQADWIQDRYLEGGIRFQSIQVGDVGSHGIDSGQFLNRTILTAVQFLIERAWPKLSIPQGMSVDNMFAKTTHPNNPFTNWVRVCLWFGAEVIVGPPGRHGWTNHIEAVNNEWQNRTIRAEHYNNLDELRQGSNRAVEWLNTCRPILNPDLAGTRYPAEYIAAASNSLRWPPAITLADYLDSKGSLTLPISDGRITFIRHVTDRRTVKVALIEWPVPDTIPIGGLVTATITTGNHQLEIRHQGEPVTRFDYPIKHTINEPYYQPADQSLLHHV
ncbi:MAG: leucine zipper domain-containing protein [Actinomycetota bacterium]|nr:leucine zipper domain-containing protein [Actinomycetota bacterium]